MENKNEYVLSDNEMIAIKTQSNEDLIAMYYEDIIVEFKIAIEEELALRNINARMLPSQKELGLLPYISEKELYKKCIANDTEMKPAYEKEIKRRGFSIEDFEEHILSLGKHSPYVVLGYIFSLSLALIGLIIGLVYILKTTASKSGKVYYIYDRSTRMHGKIIAIISIIAIHISIISIIMGRK